MKTILRVDINRNFHPASMWTVLLREDRRRPIEINLEALRPSQYPSNWNVFCYEINSKLKDLSTVRYKFILYTTTALWLQFFYFIMDIGGAIGHFWTAVILSGLYSMDFLFTPLLTIPSGFVVFFAPSLYVIIVRLHDVTLLCMYLLLIFVLAGGSAAMLYRYMRAYNNIISNDLAAICSQMSIDGEVEYNINSERWAWYYPTCFGAKRYYFVITVESNDDEVENYEEDASVSYANDDDKELEGGTGVAFYLESSNYDESLNIGQNTNEQ